MRKKNNNNNGRFSLYDSSSYLFDRIARFWKARRNERSMIMFLSAIFLGMLGMILIKKMGFLPEALSAHVPTNFFAAADLAFTMVLVIKMIDLILVIPCSFSQSIATQFKIFALVLLRGAFKELIDLPEPIHIVEADLDIIVNILAHCFGALSVFALLGVFIRLDVGQQSVLEGLARYAFVSAKKILSLALIVIFIGQWVYAGWAYFFNGQSEVDVLAGFFTILIFCDILIIFLYQGYSPGFLPLFRNSGFVVCTLLLRLAFTAPPLIASTLGVISAALAVILGVILKYLWSSSKMPKKKNRDDCEGFD